MNWTVPDVWDLDPDYYEVLLEEMKKEQKERALQRR